MLSKKIGIIGLGNLGIHLTKMLIKRSKNSSQQISILSTLHDSNNKSVIFDTFGDDVCEANKCLDKPLVLLETNQDVINQSDIVILSVKPGQIKTVCDEIAPIINPGIPIISVAAAVPLHLLYHWLPDVNTIIRCMPNIACSINEGTILYHSLIHDTEIMNIIFNNNLIIRVNSDAEIDIATLISGCGPALLAQFVSYLQQIGQNVLTDDVIKSIISQTMIGTGHMLKDYSISQIIGQVASPQGATEAILDSFKSKHVDKEILESLLIARDRIKYVVSKLE